MTKKISIVYAEDSKSVAKVVMTKLKTEGYDIFYFENGQGVVEAVIKNRPSVVILDNEMPVKDGMSILRELKVHPEVKNIPVIFLTTFHDQQSVIKCLELGVADYIVKDPLALSEIVPRIKKWLR
jgi:two-component system phosphate regulon response regulator PhoB